MRWIKRWLLPLGVGYLTLVALAAMLQGCMVHFPSRDLVGSPADRGLGYEEVTITTRDDQELHSWFIPAPEAQGVLLFLHGNAGNISHRLESLEIFHQLGMSVLIIDYRGYGKSTGRPSEEGLKLDAEAGLHYLVEERGYESEQVVAFGRSLGAALSAELASRHSLAGVILESAFTSLPDIGSDLYPFLPVRLLLRYEYDTKAALVQASEPVLVIHSEGDEIIPYSHGRALYDAAPEPRYFLTIQGDHNTGFLRSRDTYMAGLRDFFETVYESP
ncbi:alpha/beta hydrolase [Marinimicrobium sp. ABcell2]|uniref:alpha/beta hydrolase n=1 Tax=Marinimicrobium sp. ABcell2 TaxID=3069751 RepID=UPI0027B091CD|nr:alpha/beta hydrolase [Marinimicrobium sp. ABcell2]MDQ2077578.1 alpha/beta hydrolase [Marinimicrobium sp. ABcell2]